MDDQTAFVLALQLIALCSVVGALILYLLCKVRSNYLATFDANTEYKYINIGAGRPVLITSIDNLLGLQVAYHLACRGFRVFAGTKPSGLESDTNESTPKKILEAKWKRFEACCAKEEGEALTSLVVLPLDVTREDLLHEAVGIVRRYLPAGEDGLWAVVNTAGLACRGRLDGQDTTHWDAVMKLNVTGTLRVAKTFTTLLRNKRGRLINIGAKISEKGCEGQASLVANTASRYAVEGASLALRAEMRHLGIKVVTLQPEGLNVARMFAAPHLGSANIGDAEKQMAADRYVSCDISVLPPQALKVTEEALTSESPSPSYSLVTLPGWFGVTDKFVKIKNSIQVV